MTEFTPRARDDTKENIYKPLVRNDDAFNDLATDIWESYQNILDNPQQPHIAFAMHHEVARQIDYDARGSGSARRPLRGPVETWNKGRGNCQEQGILLASLLLSSGFDCQGISVKSTRGNYHLIPEFKTLLSHHALLSAGKHFYEHFSTTTSFSGITLDTHSEREQEFKWVIVDPGWSDTVGDLDSLVEAGYVHRFDNGAWTWEYEPYYHDLFKPY